MVSKRTDERFVFFGGGSIISDAFSVVLVELLEFGHVNVDLQIVGLAFTVSEIEIAGLSSWISGDMIVENNGTKGGGERRVSSELM